MKNLFEVDGYKATIDYDPEIEMFRGEFIGLNGSADFYASDIAGLKQEAQTSLKVFLQMCQEKDLEPKKQFSGRFNVRIPSSLHEQIVTLAQAEHKSLNSFVEEAIEYRLIHSN